MVPVCAGKCNQCRLVLPLRNHCVLIGRPFRWLKNSDRNKARSRMNCVNGNRRKLFLEFPSEIWIDANAKYSCDSHGL